jgi:hypothetical protein
VNDHPTHFRAKISLPPRVPSITPQRFHKDEGKQQEMLKLIYRLLHNNCLPNNQGNTGPEYTSNQHNTATGSSRSIYEAPRAIQYEHQPLQNHLGPV